MFGISEFNRNVLEHPEILIPIIEEEEEEEEFMCFPLQNSFVDAEGAAPVAVVFVLICLIASILDRLYFFVRAHTLQVGGAVFVCAVGYFLIKLKQKIKGRCKTHA